MPVHSAFNITHLGRTLRINKPAPFPGISDILILTKKTDSVIKEKTRITSAEIAKSSNLRKFLNFSENTQVKVGSFEISMAGISSGKEKFNILINDSLFFLTFLPDISLPFKENTTLLLPADSGYFASDDLPRIREFIMGSKPSSVIISGNYSEKWFTSLKGVQNLTLKNEAEQENLFI